MKAISNQISLSLATNGQAPAITYEYEQLGLQLKYMVGNMTTSYGYMNGNLTTQTANLYQLMYVTELKISDSLKDVTFLDNGVVKTISG